MKKIYGFAFAAAIMSLASCSNESEPVVTPTPDAEVNGYVSFHISTPNGTRAGDYKGLDNGLDAERNVKDATFLFFDANKKQTQAPQTIALSKDEDATNGLAEGSPISDILNPVVAVAGRDDLEPTHAIVVVNCPASLKFSIDQDMDAVLASVTEAEVATANAFTMSNAAYFTNSGAKVIATELKDPSGNSLVKPTRQEAKEAPVEIYVERLAAKISLTFATDDDADATTLTPTAFNLDINGQGNVEVTPVITSLVIANKAKTMQVVKKVEDGWSALAISEPANFRVNWAVTPVDTELINDSYTNYTGGSNALDKADDAPFYVKENTLASGEEISNKTSVLITAKLTYKDDKGAAQDLDLVRWAGVYYTPDAFLTQACNFLSKYYVKVVEGTNTKYENFADVEMLKYQSEADHKTDWDNSDIMQYETLVEVVADKVPSEIYTYDADKDAYEVVTPETGKTIADVLNAELAAKSNRCWYWNAGKAYYYVEVAAGNDSYEDEKLKDPDDLNSEKVKFQNTTMEYGVVRNNSYAISLRSLTGVGVPVYNPGEVIIPQTPKEKLWFVGAKIKVLKWRTVSQNADFGGEY